MDEGATWLLRLHNLCHVGSVLMAAITESHIVRLILHQKLGLCARVWLMAAHAAHGVLHFVDIGGVHHIPHRMAGYRMAQVVTQGKNVSLILLEVVFRQPNFAVEDG